MKVVLVSLFLVYRTGEMMHKLAVHNDIHPSGLSSGTEAMYSGPEDTGKTAQLVSTLITIIDLIRAKFNINCLFYSSEKRKEKEGKDSQRKSTT